jgi:putative transcriptional regulator
MAEMIHARAVRFCLLVLLLLPLSGGWAAATESSTQGRLLVASPRMTDPNFARTVVYMVAHDGDGAFGLVVNRAFGEGSLAALLAVFGLERTAATGDVRLHYGGPVQLERGFVLHSRDWEGESTVDIGQELALSIGPDVIEAIAAGDGPARRLVLLGYAGWGPGQLDSEIAREDWLIAPVDDDALFAADPAGVYEAVLKRAGLAL